MQTKQQKPSQRSQNNTKKQQSSELTFLDHIRELRSRLFWIVFTIVLVSAAGFQFKDWLIAVVMDPLHGQKLVYLTPGGGFSFIFTLCIYFGVLVAIPVIVYQIYRFLQPLLQRSSRRLIVTFMALSCLLAVGGAAFGYFVTIPAALDFLATFAGDAVTPNLTADSYLNFVVAYVLGLALLFQLPLLLFLFDHVRPFPPGSLLSTQRFVIVGATIVAAIITPTPDAVNMAIVAVPIIAIYQFGVVAVFARHRARIRSQKRAQSVQHPMVHDEPLDSNLMTYEEEALQRETKQEAVVDSQSVEAEPLTAVVAELNREEKPEPVRFSVADMFKELPNEQHKPAAPIAPRPKTGRAVDGFIPKTQSHATSNEQSDQQPVRTIDGIYRSAPSTGTTS